MHGRVIDEVAVGVLVVISVTLAVVAGDDHEGTILESQVDWMDLDHTSDLRVGGRDLGEVGLAGELHG